MRLGLAAFLSVLAAAPAASPAPHARSAARVSARLTFEKRGEAFRDVRLTIVRNGRVAARIAIARRPAPYWRPVTPATVRDLDADGEPEVLVDVFTGGAHCCTRSHVFSRVAGGRYVRTTHDWGNPGYRLRDLDGNRTVELVTGDDRFTYTFAAYAVSAQPLQVWRFEAGRLTAATREYLPAVRADAARLWRRYRQFRRKRVDDVRGVLAAWMADKALLGEAADGWRALEAARRRGQLGRGRMLYGTPAGRAYVAALRRFLRRTGYLR